MPTWCTFLPSTAIANLKVYVKAIKTQDKTTKKDKEIPVECSVT
jgi:hypothetical protein